MTDFRALSVRLEDETGYDSIPTIERIYEDNGRYPCCYPGCTFTSKTPERTWRHVHFSRKHDLSFGVRRPEDIKQEGAGS